MALGTDPYAGGGGTTPAAPPPDPMATPPTAPASSGGKLGADPYAGGSVTGGQAPKSSSSGGGVFHSLLHAAAPIFKAVDAPGQIVKHVGSGLGDIIQGKGGEGVHHLAQAGIKLASVGQRGEDVSFTQAIGAKKLPFGLETLGNIVSDPVTFMTMGTGAEAGAALKTLEEAGHPALSAIKSQGLHTLDEATKQSVRETLLNSKTAVKNAEHAGEITDKAMQALESRGRGGFGFHVPGTNIDQHVAGSFTKGPISTLLEKMPDIHKALSPAAEAAAGEGGRLGKAAETETLRKFNEVAMKTTQKWKQATLAFPGTILNRIRRIFTMNALDGIPVGEQLARRKEFNLLRDAGESVEKKLGLDPTKLDFEVDKLQSRRLKEIENFDKAREAGIGTVDEQADARARDYAAQQSVQKERAGIQSARDSGQKITKKQEAARITQASREGRNAPLPPGTVPSLERPQELDFRSALDQALQNKGSHIEYLKEDLGKNAERYINLREIMHEMGDGLYKDLDVGKGASAYSKYKGAIKKASVEAEIQGKGVNALHNLDRFGDVRRAAEHASSVHVDPWKLTKFEATKIKPFNPFWGPMRSHLQGVGKTGFDNPFRASILHHVIANTPLGAGSGAPTESAAEIVGIPASIATGNLRGAAEGLGGVLGGPLIAAERLALNPKQIPTKPGAATADVARTLFPSAYRLPVGKKKASVVQQIAKYLTGFKVG